VGFWRALGQYTGSLKKVFRNDMIVQEGIGVLASFIFSLSCARYSIRFGGSLLQSASHQHHCCRIERIELLEL
jgi:hypothetical protein